MSEINVGVVGYGLGGKVFHCPLIQATEGLNLYAVCSRTEEKRAAAKADYEDLVTYATVEELLADPNLDLVVISTPHDTHAPLALQAFAAKKHVVMDKPIAVTTQEADQMIAAAKEQGVLFSVFQNRRWDGDYLTVKQAIESGWLGEVYTFESRVVGYGLPGRTWRGKKEHGGGRLRDWGAHLVDQALQLFGEVETVWADLQYRHWDAGFTVESGAVVWLRFTSGVRALLETNCYSRIPQPRFYVHGSLGSLEKYGLDPQEEALKRGIVRGARDDPAHYARLVTEINGQVIDARLETQPGNYLAYYANIAAALLQGAELAVKPEESREGLRVIEAAFASAETGGAVCLGEV
ncbi:MAG TPA: oxidoreductase [Armatimonadetes bacterium]|nr:oxidoreductase [Armatimonadota bacterium]